MEDLTSVRDLLRLSAGDISQQEKGRDEAIKVRGIAFRLQRLLQRGVIEG